MGIGDIKPLSIKEDSDDDEPKKKKSKNEPPYLAIITMTRKYMGTKKRWKIEGCTEPDYLAAKGILDWAEANK